MLLPRDPSPESWEDVLEVVHTKSWGWREDSNCIDKETILAPHIENDITWEL